MESWNRRVKGMELAALLDESPYHRYRATEAHEPWGASSALTAAARTIDLEGFAWLFLVYKSDPVETWGSKKVKVMGGGRILRAETMEGGVETGKLILMQYEVVAPEIYRTVVGKHTTAPYIVVTDAEMAIDPKMVQSSQHASQLNDDQPDPIFGYYERAIPAKRGRHSFTTFPRTDIGCFVWTMTESGHEDKMFLDSAMGLEEFRFELTECARRPFVHIILARLGLVVGHEDGMDCKQPSLEQASSGLVRNLSTTLMSLIGVIAWQGVQDRTTSRRNGN